MVELGVGIVIISLLTISVGTWAVLERPAVPMGYLIILAGALTIISVMEGL